MQSTTWDDRPDVMLRIAKTAGVPRERRVRAMCACVRVALEYVPNADHRSLDAVEIVERWCDYAATLAEVTASGRLANEAATHATTAATYAAAAAASSLVRVVISDADGADVIGFAADVSSANEKGNIYRKMAAIIRGLV